MLNPRLRQQGFSLIELLVTLAILLVVAGLAAPSVQSLVGGSEISATSNHFVYSLQSARSEAIKRIEIVGLCPSQNPTAQEPTCGGDYTDGWIVFVDSDASGARSDGDIIVLQNEALSPAYSITPDQQYQNVILFGIAGTSTNSSGIPVSGQIKITDQHNGQSRQVRVAASGRITTTDLSAETAAGDTL